MMRSSAVWRLLWLFSCFFIPLEARNTGWLEPHFTKFRFLVEPQDLYLLPNQQAILHCDAEVGGNFPRPTIKWKRDGQSLHFPDFNDRSFSRSDWVSDAIGRRLLSNGSLYFANVLHSRSTQPDSGLYQCVVSVNGLGTMVSKTAKLTVADVSILDIEPTDITVSLGQTAVFQCEIQKEDTFFGNHHHNIVWLKNDQPLAMDHRMKLMPSGMLEITDVKISDKGHYKCNVTTANEDGGNGSQKQLLSQGASLKLNFDGGMMPAAPKFLATPRDTKSLADEGSEVTLDCAANGTPMPEIMWLKDGETIDLNHLDSRLTKIGTGSLNIKEVRPQDAGTYQCRAQNSEDSIDSAAILEVLRPPTFVQQPQNTVALEKGDVTLDCEVAGHPQPVVQWYKNGDLIIESEYFQMVGGQSLKILGLVGLDAGIYQCVATNIAGNVQSAAELRVMKKLVEAKLLSMKSEHQQPSNQILERSADLSDYLFRDTPSAPMDLEAAIVASRFITLRWSPPQTSKEPILGYSIFYKQENSERERVLNSTKGNLEEINIQGLSPGGSYLFRVVALNQHGLGSSSSTLRVSTQPDLDVPGPISGLEAKATTSFSILVSWSSPKQPRGFITKYKLYYRQGDFVSPTKNVIVDAGAMQFHVTELREFTEYTFYVSAFNANGEGALSEEITCMTLSDIPADPPQNISLEASSSTSIIVRWEPPPKESQNGIITGYKIRWRARSKSHSDIVTTDGSRRLYALTGLKKDREYQIKLAAMTVNGTGPATSWLLARTLEADLDESVVPDPPSGLKAVAEDTKITIYWRPPRKNRIKGRGYTIGWGKGIPDEVTQIVDDKHRNFVIANLKPNSEYVISLRAYNNVGDGRPIYETVRTKDKGYDGPEAGAAPLIPPVGLHAIVLSSSTVVLTWVDSSLPRNQVIPDARYYVIRYSLVSQDNAKDEDLLDDDSLKHYSYRNATDLNLMIDDLRPASEYEFSVKIVRGRRQSPWSLVVNNRTREDAPASSPRDVLIRQGAGINSLHLSWRPPRFTNGHINGYVIQYTTNRRSEDRDWFVEAVIGDGTMATIRNVLPDTTYYFKMSARNNKGYGPPGQIVTHKTAPDPLVVNNPAGRGVATVDESNSNKSSANDGINPIVLYAVFGIGAGIILVLVIGSFVLIRMKCQSAQANDPRSNKNYHHSEAINAATRDKLNPNSHPPPPDLWIGHDQLELKDISDENGSAICDETGETTLTRSTPDYRATMERTRNYIQNGQFSGTESEVSFSLLNGSRNHNNRHSGLDNSTTTTSTRILMSPGTKPVKIAAISGKPRVQRYLSRESVSSSIANGSSASSSTYIRSQYNLNPPPLLGASMVMDMSLTSPDDLPPLAGYDPSLTCTESERGPPSTIGDPEHSGTGSILGIGGAIPAQPPQVPPTYLSSAMSTSSGDSSTNTSSHHHNGINHNLNSRRQSSGSHSSHLRSFSTSQHIPKSINPAPSSPFKKPLNLNHNNTSSAAFGFSSNGSDSGSSMATTSSSSGGGGRQNSSSSNSGGNSASHHPGMERTNLLDSPFQSGHLPTIADVRSPDVLHCQDGPCDCLSHTLKHSLSTEELNAEMKNLEGLMKDLNSISPVNKPSSSANNQQNSSFNC